MVFREDLEGGSLGRAAIDAKVAEYRAKLIAESDSAAAEADRKAALARCASWLPRERTVARDVDALFHCLSV